MKQGVNRQMKQITIRQRKKNAVTGIVFGAIALIFGVILAVTGMFFYIDASVVFFQAMSQHSKRTGQGNIYYYIFLPNFNS